MVALQILINFFSKHAFNLSVWFSFPMNWDHFQGKALATYWSEFTPNFHYLNYNELVDILLLSMLVFLADAMTPYIIQGGKSIAL